MPNNINQKRTTFLYIYGSINSKHIFHSKYLLEYNSLEDFYNNFNNENQKNSFDKYINSIQFKDNFFEKLTDIDNKPLGLIYNLEKALAQLTPVQQNANKDISSIPKTEIPLNKPPLIGLEKIGFSCYMNATLQCLSQIFPLVDYFKNNSDIYDIIIIYKIQNRLCLSESFKLLINNLWPEYYNNNHKKNNNNYYFTPYEFKEKISKMNHLFEGNNTKDPKDLLNFIIITLHEELKIYQKNNNNENLNINIKDQANQNLMLNNFMNNYFKKNKSIIGDIFCGVNHYITNCSKCKIPKHNYEVYYFLFFPLEEIRKYKLQTITDKNINLTNQMNTNHNMMMNMNLQEEFYNNLNKIKLIYFTKYII